MIGMILCGHGNFASGMYSAIKLIAGDQEDFATVDFSAGMSSEELKEQLLVQIAKTENGNGVVIFTDIPGGTPFNQAVLLSTENESVKIVSGTNLPLLLESSFNRDISLTEFVSQALKSGAEGLKTFKIKETEPIREDSFGI
ncbi:PTS galactosamine/N-acetylgalactosamine transporter subunit IIA [Carnobacterium sp.]|uniref:PTS galactosamine/N-acetylgalactosamine transporter subunit IIA n=1 Tax=Carnobacterium sp. TaxID=48221 RepID=UPI002FCAEFF0